MRVTAWENRLLRKTTLKQLIFVSPGAFDLILQQRDMASI